MKQLLIMTPVLLASFPSEAKPGLGIAFKGGPNAATLAEDDRSNRYSFSGGPAGYLQWSLVDRFSLAGQLELLYTPRGAEVISGGDHVGESRERYFDLMLVVRPEIRLGQASVYLLLGGGLNLLLSAEIEDVTGAKSDITDDLHRIDVAFLGGAGVALRLPRRELGPLRLDTVFLEARHDRGLIDTDAVNGGFKNRTSSLMLGLSFALASEEPANPAPPPARSNAPSPATAAVLSWRSRHASGSQHEAPGDEL
jgi:hypothetical protein